MASSCEIKFDSPEGIYYAGQTLSTQIDLKITKPFEPRSISILIKGRARCSWVEKKSWPHKEPRSTTFEGEQVYLETVTHLHNEQSHPKVLPAGTHTFNAVCVLPTSCPTSFESSLGHIRYFAKVTVEGKSDPALSFKRAFMVIRQYDLNYESSLRLPVELQRDNTLCCWPCRSGPFKWRVLLPMGGYAPGQKIPIHVDIVNHSGSAIGSFRFFLRRIVHFHATNPKNKTRSEKELVLERSLAEKALDYGETRLDYILDIPSVAPTNITNSKTIQVTYELKVSAVTPGLHKDISMKIPIVIGTVPLYPLPIAQLTSSIPGGPSSLPESLHPNQSRSVKEILRDAVYIL